MSEIDTVMTQEEQSRLSLGDLAAQASEKLQKEHQAGIDSGTIAVKEDQEVMHKEGKSILSKIRFSWRTEDKLIIEQLKAGANSAFLELYDQAFDQLDSFYDFVRTPMLDRNGKPQRDIDGRIVWEKDSRGMVRQDWTRVTGQDIETILYNLQEVKLYVAPRLNELLLEAMMAKHVYDDQHAEAYSSVVDGTIGDRTAKANRVARTDKYAAFFRFWLWSSGDSFMKELNNFQRLLEKTRDWQIRSEWNRR